MHYNDLLGSIARLGHCILVPDLYLVLHEDVNSFLMDKLIEHVCICVHMRQTYHLNCKYWPLTQHISRLAQIPSIGVDFTRPAGQVKPWRQLPPTSAHGRLAMNGWSRSHQLDINWLIIVDKRWSLIGLDTTTVRIAVIEYTTFTTNDDIWNFEWRPGNITKYLTWSNYAWTS